MAISGNLSTVDAAALAVLALNLSSVVPSALTLMNLDPVAAYLTGTPGGVQILSAALQLMNTATALSAVGGSSSSSSATAYTAIAQLVVATGGLPSLNLGNATTVTTIAVVTTPGLSAANAGAVGAAVSGANGCARVREEKR